MKIKIGRKGFIKKIGILGSGVAFLPFFKSKSFANEFSLKSYFVFVSKKKSCNACKNHALNKRFGSYAVANNNRSHKYCTCEIAELKCSDQEFNVWFRDKNVFDLRWEI